MTLPRRDPGLGPGAVAGPLWSRDARLFVAARGAAKLGDAMLPIALAAGLIRNGHGAGAVGLVMAAHTCGFLVFVIVGGVVSDRLDARRLMIHADLVRTVSLSGAAGLFLLGVVEPWQLCMVSAVNGTCAGLFQPGLASTVPRIARDVQAMNAAVKSTESAVTVLGPAVAGVLLTVTSPGVVFAVHAGMFLASAACLAEMRSSKGGSGTTDVRAGATSAFRADLGQGWREFRDHTWLWGVVLVWMLLTSTVTGPITPLSAAGIVGRHGTGSYALANTALGVGMVAGGLLAWRVRPPHPLRVGAFALSGLCLQPAAVGCRLPLPVIVVAFAAAGAAVAFWNVMWATSVQTQVPADVLNRVHGFEVAGCLVMLPVGQAAAGPAADAVGLHSVMLFSAVMTVVVSGALLAIPSVRGLNRGAACGRRAPVTGPTRRRLLGHGRQATPTRRNSSSSTRTETMPD